MYEVKIINEQKKIAYLKWEGIVKPNEVAKATEELVEVHKKFGKEKYYIVVDLTKLKVFGSETKELIIEQQKTVLKMIHASADVFQSILSEKHINETKEKSNHQKGTHFKTVEEAIKFLEEISIYK